MFHQQRRQFKSYRYTFIFFSITLLFFPSVLFNILSEGAVSQHDAHQYCYIVFLVCFQGYIIFFLDYEQ